MIFRATEVRWCFNQASNAAWNSRAAIKGLAPSSSKRSRLEVPMMRRISNPNQRHLLFNALYDVTP
jgi:hypothetical protein